MTERSVQDLLTDARETYGVFGKAERALTAIDRALAMEPNNIEALNLKAAILYELDRDGEAQALHEQVLSIEPCSVEALHGLSALANDRHSFQVAVAQADRALDCIPDDPDAELRENEDYRQRLVAELFSEKAFALWYLDERAEAVKLLTVDGPAACPLEVETFEEQLDWLKQHPDSPDEE